MYVIPGGDLDLYLEVSRNGEPVNSETQPVVSGIWFNGANLITTPVSMSQLGTGLYFVSVELDASTALGNYIATLEYTRLGVVRRDVIRFAVIPDQQRMLELVEGNLPENTSMEFIPAAAPDADRKVAAGRLSEITYTHKLSAHPDFTTPVAQGTRKYRYAALGNVNPIKVGD